MDEKDGVFRPQSPCRVTEGWAVFLYALSIEPDTKASYWERAEKLTEPVISSVALPSGVSPSSSVSLQIPGEVFCHVINLFSESEKIFEDDVSESLHVAFGTFSWEVPGKDTKAVDVQFAPDDDVTISRTRMPFPRLYHLMAEHTIITRYRRVFDEMLGCSDHTLAWPDPKSPLRVRLAALRANFERVQNWGYRHDETYLKQRREYDAWRPGQPRPSSPRGPSEDSRALIFSPRWLAQANRIAARATTCGGADNTFLKDCVRTLRKTKQRGDVVDVEEAKEIIREGFMFRKKDGSDRYYAVQRPKEYGSEAMTSDEMPGSTTEAAKEAIDMTLEGYINAAEDWKKQLYEARDDVSWLVHFKHTLWYDSDVVHYIKSKTFAGSRLWTIDVMLR